MPREVLGLGEGLAVGPIQVMTFQLTISTANLDNVMTKFISMRAQKSIEN